MKGILNKVKIRMNRSFDEFIGSGRKNEFLDDLSFITGVPADEIYNVVFRNSCVIFEGEMDKEAVQHLLEMYNIRNSDDENEDLDNLKKFILKHSIVEITDDFTIRITIKTNDKSSGKLIFIHGWRGDKDSFGNMPEMLSDLTGCNSLVYEYPTGIWEKSPAIQYVSRNLDNWIRNYASNAKLAIICHSMGGIVTRKFVVSQSYRANPLDKQVKQITFIASPHSGVSLAKLGKHIPTIQKAQISDLSPESSFLVELNEQWLAWCNANVPANCITRSIYGTSDDVVDKAFAIGNDPEAIPILNANHVNIVKPENKKSEIVITLHRLIKESDFFSC